jgi:predicted ATP-grasp superfamily ATP-dependent carboligase
MEGNGLGVTRALARHAIPCVGVGVPAWQPAYATRTCRVVRCPEWSSGALVEELLTLGREFERKAPLLITKDEPVLWISEHRDVLDPFYEINLPRPDVVQLLMSKIDFLRVAVSEGWPIPKTWIVNERDELIDSLPDIPLPCILKPAVKNSDFRRHSPRKAFKVASHEELIAAYDLVSQWEREVVVQEWVGGEDDRISYCLAYYDREGEPLAHYPGRKLRQWPVNCGNTAIAAPAPESWAEPITSLTRKIFEFVGFRGLGSIEFKMGAAGEPAIMEPTVGRTNYQNEIAVLNGVNIPAIAYFDLVGSEGELPASAHRKQKLIDGWADLRASRELRRSGRLTFWGWLGSRRGPKRYMLWRLTDPGPFMAFAWGFFARSFRRLLRLPSWLFRRLTRSKRA